MRGVDKPERVRRNSSLRLFAKTIRCARENIKTFAANLTYSFARVFLQ